MILFHAEVLTASPIWYPQRTVIAGKILNLSEEHKTIRFLFNDLLNPDGKSFTANIDQDGNFSTVFFIAYPQDFYVDYGTLATIFCSPGDSLYLQVDADIFKNPNNKIPNGDFFVNVTGGTATNINKIIIGYLENLPNEKYIYSNAIEAVKSKTPEQYRLFIKTREKEYLSYYEQFIKENETDEVFRKWALDNLYYGSLNDLMRYRWYHAHLNDIENMELPESYFNFLKDYNMNDHEIISMIHNDFLDEFSRYSYQHPGDSLIKIKQQTEKGFDGMFPIIKNMIVYNSSGFTRELFLAKLYLQLIQAQQITEFKKSYSTDLITNTYFTDVIDAEYGKLVVYMSNQNTENANIQTLSENSSVLKEIISKYANKVIYIDFWAPWCSPCMKEIPDTKNLQAYFKNEKEVVFIFLACECGEESWKATIANNQLTGEHIRLTTDQYNVLSSEFGFSGIPHHALIDKKGSIAAKNTQSPQEKEAIIEQIVKLLDKKSGN
jgi:thiol-disulfide isomerase/thioredoxin